jgi:hypothetical protein
MCGERKVAAHAAVRVVQQLGEEKLERISDERWLQ